jgi:hypothetical protein
MTRRDALTGFLCRKAARIASNAAALVGLGILAACGGEGGPSTGPTPLPANRLIQEGGFTLRAPEADAIYFTVFAMTDPGSGRWQATVDWTFATNTLWMYVATGTCTAAQFAAPECPSEPSCQCQFAVRSEAAAPKPRVLTVDGALGGTRTLIIANLGPSEESGTYRVMLTPQSAITVEGAAGAPNGAPVVVSSGTKAARSFRRTRD